MNMRDIINLVEAKKALPIYWHGSAGQIDPAQFRPLTHFGSRTAALERLKAKIGQSGEGAGWLYPVTLNIQNPLKIRDRKDFLHSNYKIVDMLFYTIKAITTQERISLMDRQCSSEAIVEVLRDKGYDGMVYKNSVEDPGHLSYIIFDAAQVFPAGDPVSVNDEPVAESKRAGVVEGKFQINFSPKGGQGTIQRITVDATSFADARRQAREWLTTAYPGAGFKIASVRQKVGDDWLNADEVKFRKSGATAS
jgi:hypothetical protein